MAGCQGDAATSVGGCLNFSLLVLSQLTNEPSDQLPPPICWSVTSFFSKYILKKYQYGSINN